MSGRASVRIAVLSAAAAVALPAALHARAGGAARPAGTPIASADATARRPPSDVASPFAPRKNTVSEPIFTLDPLAIQLDEADALFRAGKFPEAEQRYAAVAARSPDNRRAALQLGRIALLSNRFTDAERWLRTAIALDTTDASAKALLAEVYYRQDRFADALPLLRAGRDNLKVQVLEGFQGLEPYRIEGDGNETRLRFLQTDPIPVVAVRVNGHEANFIIDTGGSEIYLEPDFAKTAGAVVVRGAERAGFAGGQTRPVEQGWIDAITLGGFTVKHVPVNIVDTKFIGRDQVAPGLRISGFLGTVMLYHFLPTIDYVRGELVLQRKTPENLKRLEEQAARGEQTAVPFWMHGSHLMVTWGSAQGSDPALYLIDTGGAGIGFVPGPSLVEDAGLAIDGPEEATEGELKVRRFTTREVSLGPLAEKDVASVFGPFPASMEDGLGFKMAGIISHTFFRPYALTIDFVGMRYFLKRG